jgi:hypothetical protein
MNKTTKQVAAGAQAHGVRVIRPLGCGGFALLKAGRWFEFKSARAMARWLKSDCGKEGAK